MNIFGKNLKELFVYYKINARILSENIAVSESAVSKWIKGVHSLKLTNAVKIANYFKCSLNYLFGLEEYFEETNYKECPPFDIQFKKILKELKVKQFKLIQDGVISAGSLDDWLRAKQTPHIESIKKLAVYFGVSMDYIAGRED